MGPTPLELAAIEIAGEIIKAIFLVQKGNWDYKVVKSLISEIKTSELQTMVWREICFLTVQ